MRGSAIAASLALSLMAMSAAPVFAQPPAQPQPAQPARAAAARAAARAARAPRRRRRRRSRPRRSRRARRSRSSTCRRVFQVSADGKAAVTRVNALIQKKQTESAEKAKALQGEPAEAADQRQRHERGGARRSSRRKSSGRPSEAERFQQDAQAEINELQQELQNEFVKKLLPILEQLANEKGLHILFNAVESGIAWATPGLDLTADVVKKLDATAKPRRDAEAVDATGDAGLRAQAMAESTHGRSTFAPSPTSPSAQCTVINIPIAPRPAVLPVSVAARRRDHRARAGPAARRRQERHRQRGVLPGTLSRARR